MVIAVQKGLENLAGQLRNMAFEVVVYGEYAHPIDAVVYHGDSGVGSVTNSVISSVSSSGIPGNHGIFMVNANGKSAADIANILRRRTYTPLF